MAALGCRGGRDRAGRAFRDPAGGGLCSAAVRFVLLILLCAPALAAPADDVKARLDALEEKVARLGAELPPSVEALHELANRVEALAREVDRLSATHSGDAEARLAIDELRVELAALERRAAEAQARLSELGETRVSRFGWDDGLYFRAPPVAVTLHAAIQPRWVGTLRNGPGNNSNFELHHGQLQLRGELYDWLAVELMLDFGAEYLGDGRVAFLRDAFVEVRPLSWLVLRAGQLKVPFGRQRLISSLRQLFPERSLATLAFTYDRDLGGVVEAALLDGRLLIQTAVMDGVRAGQTSRNDNLDLSYTARVVAQPLGPLPPVEGDLARTRHPRFAVGMAFNYNLVPSDRGTDLDRNGVVDNVGVWSVEAEAAVKWRGFAVEGEYFYRLESAGAGVKDHPYYGLYAQASAMVWRGLQLGARFSYAQPHVLGGGKLGLFGAQPLEGYEASGVVSWFVWREYAKVQLAYNYRRDTAATGAIEDGHVVEVQLQAGF
jgi:hypothetical protein